MSHHPGLHTRIALVTLNRPAVRNGLSIALLAELRQAMAALDDDEDVTGVILTGADPAFCAGLDLKELGSGRKNLAAAAAGRSAAIIEYPFARLAKPVIGAINGSAVTGGLEARATLYFPGSTPGHSPRPDFCHGPE